MVKRQFGRTTFELLSVHLVSTHHRGDYFHHRRLPDMASDRVIPTEWELAIHRWSVIVLDHASFWSLVGLKWRVLALSHTTYVNNFNARSREDMKKHNHLLYVMVIHSSHGFIHRFL